MLVVVGQYLFENATRYSQQNQNHQDQLCANNASLQKVRVKSVDNLASKRHCFRQLLYLSFHQGYNNIHQFQQEFQD